MREATKVASLVFPFEPVPASRPRVTRWGTYYSKTYTTWKKHAEAHLKPGDLPIGDDEPLLVVIFTVNTKARTSKLRYPRADTDNLAKGPMDVVTKATGYWKDDKQVVHLISSKRFAEPGEEARSEVHIYRMK